MAYVFVQGQFSSVATGVGAVFSSNNTAGNTIVVAMAFESASTPTIADSRGNTYTLAKQQTNASPRAVAVWVAHNVAAGANTVTITLAGQVFDGALLEYSGLVSTDQVAGANATSTTPASGNTPTTTSANEMLFGIAMSPSAQPVAGAGFTSRVSAANNVFIVAEDKRVTSTGAYSAAFTSTNVSWIAVAVTLAEPGGAVASRLGLLGVG